MVSAPPGAHKSARSFHIRTDFAARGASLVTLRRLEDRACTRLVDELVTSRTASSGATLKHFLDREIADLDRFDATVYKLSAPPARAVDYRHFVYANEGALDLFRKLEPYLVGNRTNTARAVQLMERASVADHDAAKYGHRLRLSACATGQMHRG